MEKKSKKSIIIGLTLLLLVTLILLGLTYAYYRTRVIGNQSEKSVSVTSKLLEVTYSDDSAVITASNIGPGYTTSKTFSVENTGNETVNYTIILDNVENNFKRTEDWTYTLTNTETNEKTTGNIFRLEEQTVLGNIQITADEINNYELTILYADSDEDQSIDMGKSLSFRINIKDASEWDKASEGTLLYAIKKDNEVVDPVSVPGKSPVGVTAFAEIEGTSSTYSLNTYAQSNRYYAYADTYTFDEESGTYSLVNPQIATYKEISTNLINKYVSDAQPNVFSWVKTKNFGDLYQITDASETSDTSITIEYTHKSSAIKTTAEEAVLSSTEDDYGTSYYFRGNVENNYVDFNGMCWRIVRVEGDGSIKITLEAQKSCKEITDDDTISAFIPSTYYENSSNSKYEYFPDYETENNSSFPTIKEALNRFINGGQVCNDIDCDYPITYEAWSDDIKSNLKMTQICIGDPNTKYDINGNVTSKEIFDEDERFLDDSYFWYYDTYLRLGIDRNPSLKCSESSIKTNESLAFTLTADEVVLAGSAVFRGTTKNGADFIHNYFLNVPGGSWWYTLSPAGYQDQYSVFMVDSYDGYISDMPEISLERDNVRPTISLISSVNIETGGDGTQGNPYVVS